MATIKDHSKQMVFAMLNSFDFHSHVKVVFVPILPGLDYKETEEAIRWFLKTRPFQNFIISEEQSSQDMIKIEKI